jgi:mRNA interferase RelE/StbE
MARAVTYSKQAVRVLRRMPGNDAQRICEKIGQYAKDPSTQSKNVTALKGRKEKRMRIGAWRVLFVEDEETLSVRAVGPRGSVYDP